MNEKQRSRAGIVIACIVLISVGGYLAFDGFVSPGSSDEAAAGENPVGGGQDPADKAAAKEQSGDQRESAESDEQLLADGNTQDQPAGTPSDDAPEQPEHTPKVDAQEQAQREELDRLLEKLGEFIGIVDGRVQVELNDASDDQQDEILALLDSEPFAGRSVEVLVQQDPLTNETMSVLVALEPEVLAVEVPFMRSAEILALTSVPGVTEMNMLLDSTDNLAPSDFTGLNANKLLKLKRRDADFRNKNSEPRGEELDSLEELFLDGCHNIHLLLEALPNKHLLKRLEIAPSGGVDARTINAISKFSNLESLTIVATGLGSGGGPTHAGSMLGVTGEEDPALEALKSLTKLRSVRFGRCPSLNDSDLAFLEHCPSLETLSITQGRHHLTGPFLKTLAENTSLRRLVLNNCTGLKPEELSTLQACQFLEELQLHGCELGEAHFAALDLPDSLQEFELVSAQNQSFPALLSLSSMPFLTRLTLSTRGRMESALLEQVAALKGLRELTLDGTGLDDAYLQDIASLIQLEYLAIRADGISQQGLANALLLKNLKTLQLVRAEIPLCEAVLHGTIEHSLESLKLQGEGSLTLSRGDKGLRCSVRSLHLQGYELALASDEEGDYPSKLTELHLSDCEIAGSSPLFEALAKTTTLRKLSFQQTRGFIAQDAMRLLLLDDLRLLALDKRDMHLTDAQRAEFRQRFPLIELR